MVKTLVLYVFDKFHDRVQKFIDNAIFYDENVDFLIISNGKKDFSAPLFVKKLLRDNVGYDFGGWSDGLFHEDLYQQGYDKFIFVNSSVVGPFIPSYYKGKWTDIYLDGLKNNVKLFGTTINTLCKPTESAHVQSYIFAMDKETLDFLIGHGIFSNKNYAVSLYDAVLHREIMMSRLIIKNGWNIGSLLPYYEDVDFTFKTMSPEEYKPFLDDVMFDKFRNKLWNEYQLVFVKGNRITFTDTNRLE
jgi:hypothetical protein